MRKRGFTLIEFVAMVSLLMILAAIMTPSYTEIVDKQRLKADAATAVELAKIAETCYAEDKAKASDNAKLLQYVRKTCGGEIPVPQYDAGGSFEVSLSSRGRATVVLKSSLAGGSLTLVKEGKFQEPDWEVLTKEAGDAGE
ncbi:MAG: hypothetical protein Q4A78_08060 [Peptostreptococcaceae bacterium]|nr:hypothetical protein [Peptostreptococcaceae bacterium]